MPIDPSSVGATGDPVKRSWNSKDALLYAVGVGAGTSELAFTTENTKDTPQQVLPTFAVIIGGGGAPFNKIGTFNPAMLVHGEQGIELHDAIPSEGEIESTGRISGIYDKGKGALVVMESESVLVSTGKPLLKTRMSAFIRGEGGFGGERGPSVEFEVPSRKADHEVTYATREDQALTYRLSVRGSQPAALGPVVRADGRLRPTDPPRPVHLRVHRPRTAPERLWRRPEALQEDGRPLFQAGDAGRHPDDRHVDRRQCVQVPDAQPGRGRGARPGHADLRLGACAAEGVRGQACRRV